MEIAITAIISLLIGIGGTLVAQQAGKAPIVVEDKTSQVQQEVIKQLTDQDIIENLCKPENTATIENMLLCREMSCLVYSRGIDSQTSGSTCEEISNIANTISINTTCNKYQDEALKDQCFELFFRRK
tara:strand:- start:2327 stop:2710 length:384 start_codon:yes stop_codon:yes gene_type:complete